MNAVNRVKNCIKQKYASQLPWLLSLNTASTLKYVMSLGGMLSPMWGNVYKVIPGKSFVL